MRVAAIISLIFFSLASVFAGGFQLNAQGTKQLSMGHTGTALFTDASSVFFNPGAFSLDTSFISFNAGSTLIFPSVQYLDAYPGNYSTYSKMNKGTPVQAYLTFKPMRKFPVSFGMGIYTPFGSRLQWEDNWKGQFIVREISLKTIFYQPTVSVRVTDWLGIGLGYCMAKGSFYLRKGVPLQNKNGEYGQATLTGDAEGNGWNAGMYVKANDQLSFGFTFRSTVNAKINNGTASFTVPDYTKGFFPDSSFTTSLSLPQIISFGVSYAINEKLRIAADINYAEWSSYDSLKIDFAKNTDKLKDVASPKNYKNSYTYRLGAQYKMNNWLSLQLGGYYDATPVPNNYVGPESPDANKFGLTCGASFTVGKNFGADISFLYVETIKRNGYSEENQFEGNYKTKVVAPGISLSYRF